jgi:hypothetical protein
VGLGGIQAGGIGEESATSFSRAEDPTKKDFRSFEREEDIVTNSDQVYDSN